jgi:Hypothetical glycosyl hydrolase 6
VFRLPARQVHLDFHTSEHISNVGARFDRKQFQKALKIGRVQSVTVFAKCHHSWSYYPTKVGRRHPRLVRGLDLLGEQIGACHAIGVRAPIYYTVGWSANDAAEHPDWRAKLRDGRDSTWNFDVGAWPEEILPPNAWIDLCPSGAYRERILEQTREICEMYAVDGLFYDICNSKPCFCENCRAAMRIAGLDAVSDAHERLHCTAKWAAFMSDCREIVLRRHPQATVFFNGQTKMQTPDELKTLQTHFELEDLPTTWGGYDKLPIRAKLYSKYGKAMIAMSGKFHTQWGEFGGFKHPDAITCEAAAMLACGAGCSFGDQLHPSGEVNLDTYRNIGRAYAYVERVEEYSAGASPYSNLGIYLSNAQEHDHGVANMLMEEQIDFDVLRPGHDDLAKYQTIVLTGGAVLDRESVKPLNEYVGAGGSLLVLGRSAFDVNHHERLVLDVGARYIGPARHDVDYTQMRTKAGAFAVDSPFLNYSAAPRIRAARGATPLADVYEPYFSRTYAHYCSHLNTPNQLEPAGHHAAIRKGRVIYLPHDLGALYYAHGARLHRALFAHMLHRLHTRPVLRVALPSAGRATLLHQPQHRRYVLHLLYAPPLQRGRCLVIEDMPEIRDVAVQLRVPEKIKRVRLPLERKTLKPQLSRGVVSVTVPRLHCHQVVIFETSLSHTGLSSPKRA